MHSQDTGPERFETVIVGGGQAGLATGYHLARRGRWDSLRVFTPARYSGLPGWAFPADLWHYPTKDEVADYVEAYAARFELPVRTGVRVDRLARQGDRYLLTAGDRRFEADNVVVAPGPTTTPGSPTSPPIWTRPSSSSTPPVTGAPPSCATAGSWWWARPTRGPRSPWRSRPPTRPGCPGPIRATSRPAPAAGSTG